jgi:hypothetical protein
LGDDDYRERLADIWSAWQRAFQEPIGGWTGVEDFRAYFERERDAMARRVKHGRPASVRADAEALRRFLLAGADLRISIRGADNMAGVRAELLADLDVLIYDLQGRRSTMHQINLRVPEDLLASLDRMRGGVARESFIRTVLERHATYYGDDPLFDARAYVAEQNGLHERDVAIAKALDGRRGNQSRVMYMTDVVEKALGVITGNSGNSDA